MKNNKNPIVVGTAFIIAGPTSAFCGATVLGLGLRFLQRLFLHDLGHFIGARSPFDSRRHQGSNREARNIKASLIYMSDRETREFVTPGGHKVLLSAYLTGRNANELKAVMFSALKMNMEDWRRAARSTSVTCPGAFWSSRSGRRSAPRYFD